MHSTIRFNNGRCNYLKLAVRSRNLYSEFRWKSYGGRESTSLDCRYILLTLDLFSTLLALSTVPWSYTIFYSRGFNAMFTSKYKKFYFLLIKEHVLSNNSSYPVFVFPWEIPFHLSTYLDSRLWIRKQDYGELVQK